MAEQTEFESEVARLLVTSLSLKVDPTGIAPNQPLFREGLGLDSIDMLEIALAVSQQYQVTLRSDDPKNGEIFASLRALAQAISERRAAGPSTP
ncbi:MAG: phosphopantetheine-binding protein [Acidiferrobacter sp.]